MIAALAFVTLAFQKLGPVLPPQCSPTFQAAVLSVEEALQNQEFAKATDRMRLLPKSKITYRWDDSKVPTKFKSEFRKARDEAFAMWHTRVPELTFEPSPTGAISISFESTLAIKPDTGLPAGRVGFFNEDPNQPRLDFVIGLKRGRPLVTSEIVDIFNDVAYGVGAYLGVADGIYSTYVMGATDLPRLARTSVSGTELRTWKGNLGAIAALNNSIRTTTALIPAKPQLFLTSTTLTAPPSLQGDRVQIDVPISNNGTGPLSFSMFPDCGCTIVTDPGTVDPGSTRLLQVAVDTRLFTSNMTKHVALFTNDPNTPVKELTLKIPLRARYRWITPAGNTLITSSDQKKFVVYLIPDPSSNLDPVSYRFDGLDAKVTMQPFKGILADPEVHQGPKPRVGFKYTVSLTRNLPPGRASGTLQVLTSNADFPNLTFTLYAQNGILAQPEDVYLGPVSKVPKSANALISAPGLPFSIKSIQSSSPHITTSFHKSKESDDYVVTINYDGLAKPGELIATIKVKTDWAKQPIVYMGVRAYVQ